MSFDKVLAEQAVYGFHLRLFVRCNYRKSHFKLDPTPATYVSHIR